MRGDLTFLLLPSLVNVVGDIAGAVASTGVTQVASGGAAVVTIVGYVCLLSLSLSLYRLSCDSMLNLFYFVTTSLCFS